MLRKEGARYVPPSEFFLGIYIQIVKIEPEVPIQSSKGMMVRIQVVRFFCFFSGCRARFLQVIP
jgi:hypothetical protein